MQHLQKEPPKPEKEAQKVQSNMGMYFNQSKNFMKIKYTGNIETSEVTAASDLVDNTNKLKMHRPSLKL